MNRYGLSGLTVALLLWRGFSFAAEPAQPAPAANLKFDTTGAQPGEQVPELTLRTLKDEPKQLSDAWHSGPALLLASSFTCPKSRSKWPEAKEIAEKYGVQLNIVIIYVIEAHPVGSVCPYKGVEDVTPENRRDGILRHQPDKLADRIDLAKEFVSYLHVDVPIYVDTMDNQAWKALGGGPNMAVLVRPDGIVAARQGWFDGDTLQKPIDELLVRLFKEEQQAKDADARAKALTVKLEQQGKSDWELYGLAREKTLDKARALLKQFPDLATIVLPTDERGRRGGDTLLIESAEAGNIPLAELLVANGADVNAQTVRSPAALHVAARHGDLPMVRWLILHHADVNLPSLHGAIPPLREAVLYENPDVVKALLAAGAKEDFFTNVALGKLEAVRTVLLADPTRATRPDGWSRVPLDYAAATGQMEIAKLLLHAGAPVNAGAEENSWRELPLHWAVRHGHAAMVELLLTAGSSPNAAVYPEATPLHIAAELGLADVARVLLAHKADLAARDEFSRTPLHVAAERGRADIVEALIRAGADVNSTTGAYNLPCGPPGGYPPELNTPLHMAARSGNAATIKALLARRAKLDAKNANGESPLLAALVNGPITPAKLENAEVLVSAGADVNVSDKDGHTPLTLATGAHAESLLKLLRQHAAREQ